MEASKPPMRSAQPRRAPTTARPAPAASARLVIASASAGPQALLHTAVCGLLWIWAS